MALLGIDYGSKKVGLALAAGQVAVPLRVIRADHHDVRAGAGRRPTAVSWRQQLREEIRRACEEHDVRTIVVGVPKPLRGGTSAQVREVEEFVAWLRREMTIPIITEDERLTSVFAKRLMRDWKGKADDDAIAAALMLQTHLER